MWTEDTDSIQKPRKSILLINKHPNNRSKPLTWCLGFPKWDPLLFCSHLHRISSILFTFVQNLYFVPRGCNVLLICTNQIWIEKFDPVKVPLALLGQTPNMVFGISWIGTIILYDNKSRNNQNQFKQKLVIGEVVKLSVTSIGFLAGRSRLHSKQDWDVTCVLCNLYL